MEEIDDAREREEFERQLRPPGAIAGWFANAPWWLVSGGLHTVVLLAAALIYVERLMAVEPVVVVGWREGNRPSIPDGPPPVEPPGLNPGILQDDGLDSTEPSIFDPLAKPAKRNETDDDEPYQKRKGQSEKFFGFTPGEGGGIGRQDAKTPGRHEAIGTGGGGGGGGSFGDRKGGRERLAVKNKGSRVNPEAAVKAALFWLARHQNQDGGWSADSFSSHCGGTKCTGGGDREYDTGVTGLSVLAFLGAGYSNLSRDAEPDPVDPSREVRFGDVVKNGVRWLLAQQDPEGCVGERGSKYMYNHAIAALALSEAYGMSPSAPLRDPAQKAIDFLVGAQNPGKGWRYRAKGGDNDTSVTGWAVMALKSAEMSELRVPRTAFDGALDWFVEATDNSGYYEVGYTQARSGTVFVPGVNERFSGHPAMSAVAVMSRIFIQKKRDPALGAAQLLLRDLPEWKSEKIDFYYWYYGSLALFQLDGPEGPAWRKWNEPMKNAIVPNQRKKADGCRHGSWDPEVERWGHEGGRVYAAAINALTLEVYYRYANVFGGGKK